MHTTVLQTSISALMSNTHPIKKIQNFKLSLISWELLENDTPFAKNI